MEPEAIYICGDLMNSDAGSKGAHQPFAIRGEPKPRIEIADAVVETPADEQSIYCRSAERDIRWAERHGKFGGQGLGPRLQPGIVGEIQRTAPDGIHIRSGPRIGFSHALKGARRKQIVAV